MYELSRFVLIYKWIMSLENYFLSPSTLSYLILFMYFGYIGEKINLGQKTENTTQFCSNNLWN